MAPLETGWGLYVILWFQSWRTPLLETIGLIFHYMGLTQFYVALLPVIYWCVDEALGRRLGVVVLFSGWLNNAIKSFFGLPRPYFISTEVHNVAVETGYGLPSGHTQGATTLAGTLAIEIKRRWMTIATVVFIVLMAFSRMMLGVHYPQDVLAGLVIGGLILAVYAAIDEPVSAWLADLSLAAQIALVVGITALLIIIHPVLIAPTSPQWLQEPVPLAELTSVPVTAVAAFFGLGVGFALDWHTLRFSASGTWRQYILRFLLGGTVLFALQYGLDVLFGALQPEAVFRFIRYGLIGLWATYGAPWVFIKLNLARSELALAD